jgi:hypothetical protein
MIGSEIPHDIWTCISAGIWVIAMTAMAAMICLPIDFCDFHRPLTKHSSLLTA